MFIWGKTHNNVESHETLLCGHWKLGTELWPPFQRASMLSASTYQFTRSASDHTLTAPTSTLKFLISQRLPTSSYPTFFNGIFGPNEMFILMCTLYYYSNIIINIVTYMISYLRKEFGYFFFFKLNLHLFILSRLCHGIGVAIRE